MEAAGATRAEELLSLNQALEADLDCCRQSNRGGAGLRLYRNYLNRRNGSYLRLEGAAESARLVDDSDWDPFQAATGYHRIAVEAIRALSGVDPTPIVLNVRNAGAMEDLQTDDVVEVPCLVDLNGPRPLAQGKLPETVRALTLAVKNYENTSIEAAVTRSRDLATLALFSNPIVRDWRAASDFVDALVRDDPIHLKEFAL
jgi:6-phospho-beta-glucosidase